MAFVALATCAWLPGAQQNGVQLFALDCGVMVVLASAMVSEVLRPFGGRAAATLLSICSLVAVAASVKAFPVDLIHVMAACVAYYCMVTRLRDPEGLVRFLVALGWLNIAAFLLQKTGLDPVYSPVPGTEVIQAKHLSAPGLMGRNYHLSFFLLPLIPLSLGICRSRPWVSFAFPIAASVTVLCSGSLIAAGVLGGMAVSAFYGRASNLVKAALLALTVGTALIFSPVIWNKLCLRGVSYFYSLKEACQGPLFGQGLGSFDLATKLNGPKPALDSSFSQFFKAAFELGLWPTLFLCFQAVRHYASIYKPAARMALMAVLAVVGVLMFHELLRFARFITIGIAVLGLYEIACLEKRRAL